MTLPARTLLALALLLTICGRTPAAEVSHPAQLMPASSLVYLELRQPSDVLGVLLDPRLQGLLQENDDVRKFLESEDFAKFRQVVRHIEDRIGASWEKALKSGIGGGVYLAGDPGSKAVLVVFKSKDPELTGKTLATLRELVEMDAEKRGKPSRLKSREYNGATAWSVDDKLFYATLGDLVVFSNKSDGLKAAVDLSSGGGTGSLADVEEFAKARKLGEPDSTGWGMVRVAPLRQAPKIGKALQDGPIPPPLEPLAGGIIEALRAADLWVFKSEINGDRLKLQAVLPHQAGAVSEKRSWFFSPAGEGAAALLNPPRTIASFSTYRDLAQLWNTRDDVFDEATVAKISQADSGLGLFFSGRDFGTEVLGELTPRMRLVVARQEFKGEEPTPAVKLPAFALVVEMKEPEKFATTLQMAYQQIVGIANITATQQGRPQLLLGSEQHNGVTIAKGSYVVDPEEAGEGAGVHFNFSPSSARVGKHFIFGSTTALVRDLADELQKESAGLTSNNSQAKINLSELSTVLEDNREALIAQNMVEDGHSREEAETQIGILLEGLKLMREGELRVSQETGTLVLEAMIGVPRPE